VKPANAISNVDVVASFLFFPGGEKQRPEIGLLLQAKLSVPDADF